MKLLITLFLAFAICTDISSQSYEEVASLMGVTFSYDEGSNETYGAGLSCVDYNQDGWDDITLCGGEIGLKFYKNTGNGFQPDDPISFQGLGFSLSCSWVDFDNDGDLDLFVARREGLYSLYENVNGQYTDIFLTSGLPATNDLTYGNSWGDYDNDGFLDLYICNYDSNGTTNYLFKNNGNGTFANVTEEAGVANGSTHSFQGLWIDYDEDGWQDLFVINDRENSSNAMYRNNGDGTFEDVTSELGLVDYFFSMCNTGGDFDNDNDLDLLVTNNPFGHRLYQFDGETYNNVASSLGVATYDHCWGAAWMDYDNNGWQDLYIACSPFWGEPGLDRFYVSHENAAVFIEDLELGLSEEGSSTHSVAVGDFNNDGMFDLFTMNDVPDPSQLFYSTPGENNFLKFTLEGTISNRDGVGAKVTCWTNGNQQTRYTFCGEGYLAQYSRSEIFGLGTSQEVDSLCITWPSGVFDFYTSLAVNETYNFIEGQGATPSITLDGEETLCLGDSVLAMANLTLENVQWNNGTEGTELWITEAGTYSYFASTNFGQIIESDEFQISVWDQPILDVVTGGLACYGDADGFLSVLSLNEISIDSVVWSSGEVATTLPNLSGDLYSFVAYDSNGCSHLGSYELIEPDSLFMELFPEDASCFTSNNGMISYEVIGGTGPFEIFTNGYDLENLIAGEYELIITDTNGCQGFQSATIQSPTALEIEIKMQHVICFGQNDGTVLISPSGGTPPYELNFDGEDPNNLGAGNHQVIITDSLACEVSLEFEINQPNDLDYSLNLTPSSGIADGAAIIVPSGATPPYDIEWSDGSSGPTNDELIFGEHSITVTDAEGCQWEIPFWIDFVGISEIESPLMIVFPNPFHDVIQIQSKSEFHAIRVYDVRGRQIPIEISRENERILIRFPVDLDRGLFTLLCIDTNGVSRSVNLSRLLD